MTTIKASCPTCGDVELTVGDVTVRVCAADNSGSYAFQCPMCRLAVVIKGLIGQNFVNTTGDGQY